jgi:redox-sensitive bicupin YhaK (pirin superfamily)
VPSTTTDRIIHLTPDDYHVIRPEDFGAPGLSARESVGPFTRIEAVGTLVTVHDSRFEPGRGIGHHPHQSMERLFYILDGTVDHDDALNRITGHMGTGDLGILTEGRRGMVHSEWNHSDTTARAYILVYPTDPTPPTASFDAIRDEDAPRVRPAEGVETKQVVTRETERSHGDLRVLSDHRLEEGAELVIELEEGEAGLIFVVAGEARVHLDDRPASPVEAAIEHTVLLPPVTEARRIRVEAETPTRILHTVTGPGFGLRRR